MVEVNLDTLESNPADTINALPGRDRSEDDPGAGKTEVEIPELEEEHAIADVSIGGSIKELNSVGICPLLAPPHNSSEDCDTGLGFAVEQPVGCEVSADHNLTVSGTEGEATACLLTDLEKKLLQSENSSSCEDMNVFASLLGDCSDQDMNISTEASNVAIIANTLVENPEKTGLELLPCSGSLSSSFGLELHPPSSHCERILEQGVHSTVASCQIPAAQFIPVAATSLEAHAAGLNSLQFLGEVDGNAHAGLSSLQGSFLQKCNSVDARSSASQIRYSSLAKGSDHGNTTSDLGRPCKSGGVFKLFGKILTTPIHEPSDCNGVGENIHSGNQLNTGWRSGGLNMKSSSVPPEGERLGLENASLRRSYGFCDGYRAQQPLQSVTRGNGQQYFGSSSVADHPLYQNWENDYIGQPQDIMFPELPRRNNASSTQQQGEIATMTGNVGETVAAIRRGDVAAAMERIEAQKRSTEQGGRRRG